MEKSKLHYDEKAKVWRDANSRKYYFNDRCSACGKPFYGKAESKYCCHKCFIHGDNPMKSDKNRERMRVRMSSDLNPTKRPEVAMKISLAMTKPKPAPTLCECGCGEYAKPGNQYIYPHGMKGVKRPLISEMLRHNNPMSDPKVREKHNEACAKKDYQAISDKTKLTMMEKYGVDNFSKTPQFREMFRGENHPGWKGGITPERQDFYNSQEWKDACRIVWGRDNATCQRCEAKQPNNRDNVLHVHHIVTFANKELRAEPNNMILLCAKCHYWVHSNKNVNNEFILEELEDEKSIAYG